jgi:hypothetical protein
MSPEVRERVMSPCWALRTPTRLGELGERALGFFHLGVGGWLMYLTWAAELRAATDIELPL